MNLKEVFEPLQVIAGECEVLECSESSLVYGSASDMSLVKFMWSVWKEN